MTQPYILIVDADVLVRNSIATYLRECGYRVVEAANEQEAHAVVQEPGLTFHMALVDVTDPEAFNGFTLGQWIRANKPDVDVVLVGSPSQIAKEAALLCQQGPHLEKPYHPEVVLDRIKRLLQAREARLKDSPSSA